METEFEDDPELRVARAADGKPPIIPDWDGPLFCYATDRIAQEGYKIKVAERVAPEREEWGWDTGWGFFSDDDDEIEDDKFVIPPFTRSKDNDKITIQTYSVQGNNDYNFAELNDYFVSIPEYGEFCYFIV